MVAQKVAVVAGVEAIPSIVASMRIEIFSDVICPWCFIGKRRFETAISRLRDRGVDVQVDYMFRPFQLDPTAPTDSPTPAKDAYAKKFGGSERATEILDHVTSVAAQDNISFNMDIAVRANTFLAHRLLSYALKQHGAAAQIALKERIMDAYFTDGKNIGDIDVLADCAESAGIDRTEAHTFLSGDEFVDEVRSEIAEAAEYGVTAVPTFIINGQWSVPGAQDVEMFERIIERILEKA
jgi:predicted DsbA family dithiol-disulfide isomerase